MSEPVSVYDLDPVVRALIQKLPAPDTIFPASKRAMWLRQMDLALQDAYGDENQEADGCHAPIQIVEVAAARMTASDWTE